MKKFDIYIKEINSLVLNITRTMTNTTTTTTTKTTKAKRASKASKTAAAVESVEVVPEPVHIEPVVEESEVEGETDAMELDGEPGTETEVEGDKKRVNLDDLEKLIETTLKMKLADRQKLKEDLETLRTLKKDFKLVSRELVKYRNRRVNQRGAGVKSDRKRSGFAALEAIGLTNELCDFLGIEHGTKLSHSVVAERVRSYIKENGLQRADNRRFIVPDEKLERLFGNYDTRHQTMIRRKEEKPTLSSPINGELQYFNLQTHLRPHFLKETSVVEHINGATVRV